MGRVFTSDDEQQLWAGSAVGHVDEPGGQVDRTLTRNGAAIAARTSGVRPPVRRRAADRLSRKRSRAGWPPSSGCGRSPPDWSGRRRRCLARSPGSKSTEPARVLARHRAPTSPPKADPSVAPAPGNAPSRCSCPPSRPQQPRQELRDERSALRWNSSRRAHAARQAAATCTPLSLPPCAAAGRCCSATGRPADAGTRTCGTCRGDIFQILASCSARAEQAGRFADTVDAEAIATQLWAIGHGLTMLVITGVLPHTALNHVPVMATALFLAAGDEQTACEASVEAGWSLSRAGARLNA